MAAVFRSRRKPKIVGRTSDDEEDVRVIRPKSKLNHSLDLDEDDSGHSGSSVVRRAPRKPVTLPPRTEPLPLVERPSYDKEYLNELRSSTTSTPKDLTVHTPEEAENIQIAALDVASKFGLAASNRSENAIPSAAEIREKKERRARLAMEHAAEEQDFIALEEYDSDGEFKPQRMQVGQVLERDKEQDTRLVRDDEDIAEGFDEFVEDTGRITLSRKGKRAQTRQEREEIRNMIEEAEGSSDEDDSDAEMNYAYEMGQTSKGMDGLFGHQDFQKQVTKPRQPKEITPIPKIADVMKRLRGQVQELEVKRVQIEKRRADIRQEKADVVAREEHIQKLLVEAGKNFENLMTEVKVKHGDVTGIDTGQMHDATVTRGLDSLGGTLAPG